MKYLKTALLVSSVALFTACGGGGSDSIDYSGNYTVSLWSTTIEDNNGNQCLGANGYININNSAFTSTIVRDWGDNYLIDSHISQDGYITAYIHLEEIYIVNLPEGQENYIVGYYEGQMDVSGGHGTWDDIDGCSGEWVAVEE